MQTRRGRRCGLERLLFAKVLLAAKEEPLVPGRRRKFLGKGEHVSRRGKGKETGRGDAGNLGGPIGTGRQKMVLPKRERNVVEGRGQPGKRLYDKIPKDEFWDLFERRDDGFIGEEAQLGLSRKNAAGMAGLSELPCVGCYPTGRLDLRC